jgi:hypothetical protein
MGEQAHTVDSVDEGPGQLVGQSRQRFDLLFVEARSQERLKSGVGRGHV